MIAPSQSALSAPVPGAGSGGIWRTQATAPGDG